MKTIYQLIPQLFENSSEDIGEVHQRLQHLQIVSEGSSTFLNTMASAKFVSAELSSSKIGANVFDSISNIIDVEWQSEDVEVGDYYIRDNIENDDINICKNCVDFMISKLGTDQPLSESKVLGYIQGIPIYGVAYDDGDNVNDTKGFFLCTISPDNNSMIRMFELFYSLRSDNTYLVHYLPNSSLYSEDVSDIYTYAIQGYDSNDVLQDALFYASLENIISDLINSYVSYDCLMNIIRRAQSDGVVSRDQIESVINQYGKTDVTTALSTMIAGMGSLDNTSVLAVIGKVLSLSDATYSSGSQFHVYTRQNFVTSIIQAVVSIVISIVSVILTAIFKALGAIILIVQNLITSFIDIFKNNIAKTAAVIKTASLTPIVNNPLATFDVSKSEWNANFGTVWGRCGNVSWDDVQDVINQSGCAMITVDNGAKPGAWFMWILPKDENTVTCQILINPTICTTSSVTIGNYMNFTDTGIQVVDNVPTTNILISGTSNHDDVQYLLPNDSNYSYMSYSDNSSSGYATSQIRQGLSSNMIVFLSDIMYRNGLAIDQTLSNFNVGGWESNSDPSHVDFGKITIGSIWNRLSYMYYSTTGKMSALAYLGVLPMLRMIENNDDTITPSWNTLTEIWNWIASNSSYIKSYLFGLQPGTKISGTTFSWELLNVGNSLATPAVEWPNLARSALINALLLSALTAVAITGLALGAKVGMKKVAFKKLNVRTYEYNEAQNKYEAMMEDINNPDSQNIWTKDMIKAREKACFKANKKLTRAWNLADKFGLSMYNGFSTGSSTGYITTNESAPLSSISSGINDLNNSMQTISGSPYAAVDLAQITKLIAG